MSKKTKEESIFGDDVLKELYDEGIYVARPICKHCCLNLIDLVTEKYPMTSYTMEYIGDEFYTLVIFLNMK